jgi:MFS family permease
MSWWRSAKRTLTAEDTLLRGNPSFARLWGSQALSQTAQNLLNFALIIRVFELAQHTRFANFSVALLILSFGVPSIVFAAVAGVYVDRWDRQKVMVMANFARALLVLGYLFFEHNLVIVLILSFMISTLTQFFAPAEAATIPLLVSRDKLLQANSLFIFTLNASFIIGYSVSTPVIALFGSTGPYYLTSLMFLIATLLVVPLPGNKPIAKAVDGVGSFFATTKREILANFQLIRANHNLVFPIFQLTMTQATVGVVLALAPALSLAVLAAPIKSTALILIIPAGVGMVLGVLAIGRASRRFTKLQIVSYGLLGGSVFLLLLGLTGLLHRHVHGVQVASLPQISIIVAMVVLALGVMNAMVSAAAQTMLQEHTTDETRGKVFGALNMMVNIAATLPILFAGILADLFSVTKVLMALGIILTGVAVAQVTTLRRQHLL